MSLSLTWRMTLFFFIYSVVFITHTGAKEAFSATQIIEVCANGCKSSTIKSALKQIAVGGTILIKGGLYQEGTITIKKAVTIQGVNFPVIDAQQKGHVLLIRADSVSIKSLVIKNSGVSDNQEYAGVYIDDRNNCNIENNVLLNNTYGIYVAKGRNTHIIGNFLSGNARDEVLSGNGIHVWYSHDLHIDRNHISVHRDGLYFEFAEKMKIFRNVSMKNIRYGMHFMFSHDNIFSDNTFTNNITGVAIMYSERIIVKNNGFYDSWGRASLGLLLKEINDSHFSRNVFRKNTQGIFMDGSANNTFEWNQFSRNGFAITIYGSCANNIFKNNNFIDNFFPIATNTRESNNNFNGNFWSQHQGFDLNADNISDKAYFPVRVFAYWINKYPELHILLNSPIVKILEMAERVFPVVTPAALFDDHPFMNPVNLDNSYQ